MAPGTKSKFGANMFEPAVFRKQVYSIEESTCDIAGTLRRPPQSFGNEYVFHVGLHVTAQSSSGTVIDYLPDSDRGT